MKIGIITFFNYCNFGAALQCAGLAQVLKDLGHEPEYIDYTCPFIANPFGLNSLKKRGPVGYVYTSAGHVFYLPRHGLFRKFRESIPHTAPVGPDSIADYADCYDAYITGSDQVWNTKLTDFDKHFFLDFVRDPNKKLSYSASFGGASIDEKRADEYAELLRDFRAVSVREDYGAELVKRLTGKDAAVLLDPTLLLHREDWEKLAAPGKKKRPTLLVYQMGFSGAMVKTANAIAREKKVAVDYIPFPLGGVVPGKYQLRLGPREWLAQFRDADYIVTDSYHGIIFAILFEKQFLVVADGQHKNQRAISLLTRLGLTDRVVTGESHDIDRPIDYARVKAILEEDRQKSIDWLRRQLDGEREEAAGETSAQKKADFDASLCCGCGACLNVCPEKAISWEKNDQGFSQPRIDQDKCIGCGLCRKVCPYEHSHVGAEADPEVYAAVHKDPEVLKNSSSGGVFTALSDAVFERGGVVYGVAFDEEYRLRYERAETPAERDRFRGSKYVQCDGADVFPRVEADLKAGREVMFTGTPCQVSGLKDYLKAKKADMTKLLLVDNICHGPASPKVWADYLDYIRGNVLKGKKIEHFNMRSKDVAWQKQFVSCRTDAGDESDALNNGSSWNKLYQTTYAIRESCFRCRFTSYDRVGDITVADYWNIENAGVKLDYTGGVNLVLVNTAKGREWFGRCADSLLTERSDKKACWQIHLERPVVANSKRADFWESYRKDPMGTIRRHCKGSAFMNTARAITPVLRKIGLYTLAVRVLSVVKSSGKGRR